MALKDLGSVSTAPDGPPSAGESARTASIPAVPSEPAAEFVVASHHALFSEGEVTRCDACGGTLSDPGESEGYGIQGRGMYMWRRGGESRFESVPLCASCASAIGMTALARWEIEEEEG